jgi:hypothetical protein
MNLALARSLALSRSGPAAGSSLADTDLRNLGSISACRTIADGHVHFVSQIQLSEKERKKKKKKKEEEKRKKQWGDSE